MLESWRHSQDMVPVGRQHRYLPQGQSDVFTLDDLGGRGILFRAFHIPGWVNDINPTIITLKRVLRYHRAILDLGRGASSGVTS